jgi:nucleoside-diphosphate-sugar epimerase
VSISRPQKFLIIGAGAHGAMVAREMLLRSGIDLIGFLDDDPGKQNAMIAGRSVLGKVSDLARIVESKDVDEVLVCIPPQSRPALHLSDARTSKGVPVRSRIMPTLEEILQSTNVISIFPGLNEPPGTDGHAGSILRPDESDEQTAVRELAHISVVPGNGNGNGHGNGALRTQRAATPIHVRTTESPATPVRNKSILITGGAGFIGSSLAERLADYNRVLLFDQSFDSGPIQYTSLLQHPNISVIQGSVLDSDLGSLVQDVDIVVHAAAILGVNRVCSAGRETLETNYVGTSRLLKALDASTNIQRFVYFSTSEVFGVNSYRVDEASRPSIGPIAESRWSYAMSKLAGEHLVASYYRETRLPIAIVRPFNIFGPRRTGDYALRRFILNALDSKPLEIHGDGTQIRSWCYIEDFCDALLQMMIRPEAIGEDFNIGHPGNTLTIYELAQKVIQLTGGVSPVTFCPSPFPDISIRVPSLEKARRLLGYEPRFDLNTGLKRTIEWYRENFMAFQPGSRSTVTSSATFLGQESAA